MVRSHSRLLADFILNSDVAQTCRPSWTTRTWLEGTPGHQSGPTTSGVQISGTGDHTSPTDHSPSSHSGNTTAPELHITTVANQKSAQRINNPEQMTFNCRLVWRIPGQESVWLNCLSCPDCEVAVPQSLIFITNKNAAGSKRTCASCDKILGFLLKKNNIKYSWNIVRIVGKLSGSKTLHRVKWIK